MAEKFMQKNIRLLFLPVFFFSFDYEDAGYQPATLVKVSMHLLCLTSFT